MTKLLIYPPSFEEIYKKADLLQAKNKVFEKKLRAFYFGQYLTAARESELLDLKYGNIEMTKMHGIDIGMVTLMTRKNRQKKLRVMPVSFTSDYEKLMWEEFYAVYEHTVDKPVFYELISRKERSKDILPQNYKIQEYTSKKTGETKEKQFYDPYAATKLKIERYFKKITFETPVFDVDKRESKILSYHLHPHLLRHFRASHLKGIYHVKKDDLIEMLGHSDDRSIQDYVAMYPTELAESYATGLKTRLKNMGGSTK